VDWVTVNEKPEEVARIMSKYDLEAIPVIDEIGRLVGRITIDDIVDVIREEADKDYQLAAGISQVVEADDSIWDLTKARLPWLFLGLIGGVGAAAIMGEFESLIAEHASLNGLILAGALLLFTWLWKGSFPVAFAISLSLITVIVVAGIIGTFIPLFLHKRGIDPAIATGPFITTSNDIFGILIYFTIAKILLGI
jgi:magnesium transporter